MERSHTRMICGCPRWGRHTGTKRQTERSMAEYLNLFWILSIPKSPHIGETVLLFVMGLSKVSVSSCCGYDGRASPHRIELNKEKSDQIYSALLAAPTGFCSSLIIHFLCPIGTLGCQSTHWTGLADLHCEVSEVLSRIWNVRKVGNSF